MHNLLNSLQHREESRTARVVRVVQNCKCVGAAIAEQKGGRRPLPDESAAELRVLCEERLRGLPLSNSASIFETN